MHNLGNRKLLIFTEFRDTVEYLIEKLRAWGYSVVTIHGNMNMDARIAAEHEFRDNAQIMVATEAAGEGINLQFCSLMVNYDIPWNPNRLEQRMGRVHRYGQQYEVHIWNLITRDTREGQILERLFDKLARMRKALGSDRVFDIIGEIIPGARLDQLLKDAIFSQRRMEEIEWHIEAVDEGSVQSTLQRVFLTGLATRHIDYSGLLKETLTAEENRLVPEYVEDYFVRAFRRLGGNIERRGAATGRLRGGEGGEAAVPHLYRVANVPYEIRRWNEDYDFKSRFGTVFRDYRRITFDKNYARAHPEFEFVAPGHALLEAVNEDVLRTLTPGPSPNLGRGESALTPSTLTPSPSPKPGRGESEHAYAIFGDPQEWREGALWFVEGEVTDGSGAAAGKRVFCLYQEVNGGINQINPAILWDLEPLPPPRPSPIEGEGGALSVEIRQLLSDRAAIEDHLITQVLLPFREEIAGRRELETHVKEKYGLRSLDYLIQESNQKILDYQVRQSMGEAVDLPLLNEKRNLETLQGRRAGLEKEIRLERNLTVSEPRILGAAAVVPLGAATVGEAETGSGIREAPEEGQIYRVAGEDEGPDPERKAEIEAVGMHEAMAYEREQGWQPEDVSGENHGFDLRSTRYDADGTFADIRYIEVKARARSGAIRLSANEWKKARHFGEKFWLYIVTEAGTDAPELHRIQDPGARFREDEDIFATGFVIPEDKWTKTTD
jgi:hypothetical protein